MDEMKLHGLLLLSQSEILLKRRLVAIAVAALVAVVVEMTVVVAATVAVLVQGTTLGNPGARRSMSSC